MRVKAAKNTRYKNPQLVAQHEKICCGTSCKFDEKRGTKPKLVAQSRPALFFSKQLPSIYMERSTNTFVARQVDHARWKTQNIDPKLATKQCCATRWRILYLISPPVASRPIVCDTVAGFWYLAFHRLKLDIAQWANFVTASEQKATEFLSTFLYYLNFEVPAEGFK